MKGKYFEATISSLVASIAIFIVIAFCKITGVIDFPWKDLWNVFEFTFFVIVLFNFLLIFSILTFLRLRRWIRRRKLDRRIIKGAEALGIWGEPKALGGRALELYAKEKRGIKREPGETDAELRRRCMEVEP